MISSLIGLFFHTMRGDLSLNKAVYTHIQKEHRMNIHQQIWCVCRMNSLKIVWCPHMANVSKQVVTLSLVLNKHPLMFAQLPTSEGM